VGVIFSPVFTFFTVTFGPIWLGILGMLIGAVIGFLIKQKLTVISDDRQ